MTPTELKEALMLMCFKHVRERKERIQESMAAIEESLWREEKNTAGDKHHTGRAMLQIQRETVGSQLLAAENVEAILHRISIYSNNGIIRLGSLVITKTANYFLSISAGMVSVNGGSYICISVGSPIGQLLLGKKKGDSFVFSGKHVIIDEVN